MNPLFTLLHASARPYGWQAVFSQLHRTAANAFDSYPILGLPVMNAEYVLVCDAKMERAFRATLPDNPVEYSGGAIFTTKAGNRIRLVVNPGEESYIAAVNHGLLQSHGQIIIMVTDDMFPPHHWDAGIAAAIQTPMAERVLWVTDQCFPHIMTCQIATSSWLRRYGYVFNPKYGSMQGDHDFTLRAQRDGVVVDVRERPEMAWKHEHHRNGLRPVDDADEGNQSSERYLQGWRQLKEDWPEYMAVDPIDGLYEGVCKVPSDINEHLPVLKLLARRCPNGILELGVRHGRSTVALLSGIHAAKRGWLRSVDLDWSNLDPQIPAAAEFSGLAWERLEKDSRETITGRHDLLFVDSLHTGDQVRSELAAHAGSTVKFIAFHDTETDWVKGEDGGPGIGGPIQELVAGGRWWWYRHYPNCNGLTVLRRDGMEDNPLADVVVAGEKIAPDSVGGGMPHAGLGEGVGIR